MSIEQMLNEIRDVIGSTAGHLSEEEVLEALLVEADGWQMRLDEIQSENE